MVRDRAGLDRAFATWFGPDSLITSMRFAPKADNLTVFTGQDAGWVAGRSDDVYTLKDGSVMTIPVRWTATVVRREGTWKVSTLHAGSNVIDNPVLDAIRDRSQRSVLWYGLGALVVGLLAGIGVGRALRRR